VPENFSCLSFSSACPSLRPAFPKTATNYNIDAALPECSALHVTGTKLFKYEQVFTLCVCKLLGLRDDPRKADTRKQSTCLLPPDRPERDWSEQVTPPRVGINTNFSTSSRQRQCSGQKFSKSPIISAPRLSPINKQSNYSPL
jgi:hypothetical protein